MLHGGTPENFNPHGDRSPRFKATRARDKGASAVLITVPRIQVPHVGQPPSSVGIPAIQVLESDEVRRWLEAEHERPVEEAAARGHVRHEPLAAERIAGESNDGKAFGPLHFDVGGRADRR